jgi:hypothetical protein
MSPRTSAMDRVSPGATSRPWNADEAVRMFCTRSLLDPVK